MAVRVGINGFGRIGRLVARCLLARKSEFEIVAINDLSDAKTLAHLLKYDTVHGRCPGEIKADGANVLMVDGATIKVLSERSPAKLPWKELRVDVALESTARVPPAHQREGRLLRPPHRRRQAGHPLGPRQGRARPDRGLRRQRPPALG